MGRDHLEEAVGGWCPVCRSAFRSGIEHCADCDVDLVDELQPRRRYDADADAPIEYELGDWTADQRAALSLRLDADGLLYSWSGPILQVGPLAEAATDALVDAIDAGVAIDVDVVDDSPLDDGPARIAELPFVEPEPDRLWRGQWPVATRSQRFVGALIDGFVLGFTDRTNFRDPVTAVYAIVGIAVWARTLGKWAAGTRVIDESGVRPTPRQAFVRWLVPGAPIVVAALLRSVPLAVAAVGWQAVVFGAVLFDDDRRGLHDRAAGTVVIRTR